jgi:chromate transporter
MTEDADGVRISLREAFLIFLRLGATCFGGPIAHLSYFREEFVERRKWLSDEAYADIVAFCQFLPGPASSQVAMILGMTRAGILGGFAAWLGFTLPSAAMLFLFAKGVGHLGVTAHSPLLHGLKIVAVAVVAQAVWNMGRTLCPDRERATLAILAAAAVLVFPATISQLGVIAAGAYIGWRRFPDEATQIRAPLSAFGVPRGAALACLAAFASLLAGLPLLAATTRDHTVALLSVFFRSGALVFGGGHVVLPLLQQATVPPRWLDNEVFLAGYGAAQAIPGPLFTFSAYLGAAMGPEPNGLLGASLCLTAIYLPSFLLLFGILPFWEKLRRRTAARAALKGVNAAVVGLLVAALYTPVWTGAIVAPVDFALALLAFLLLVFWSAPPWAVVIVGAATSALFTG